MPPSELSNPFLLKIIFIGNSVPVCSQTPQLGALQHSRQRASSCLMLGNGRAAPTYLAKPKFRCAASWDAQRTDPVVIVRIDPACRHDPNCKPDAHEPSPAVSRVLVMTERRKNPETAQLNLS